MVESKGLESCSWDLIYAIIIECVKTIKPIELSEWSAQARLGVTRLGLRLNLWF